MTYKPISDYGLIGDTHSAALVGLDGSIDWACFPRFDSPSVFAALLDDKNGGRFCISPTAPFESRQEYLGYTNILVTAFTTDTGQVTVTDFMPLAESTRPGVPPHEIHRVVRCIEGRMELSCLFQPRFDYARGPLPRIEQTPDGIIARGVTESMALSSPLALTPYEGFAEGSGTLEQGQEVSLVLSYGARRCIPVRRLAIPEKLKRTRAYWEAMVHDLPYHGQWKEEVVRSFLVLHLMVYGPTGAIVAAPTTSLPEVIGGERNWDYRYTWLRDASFTLGILYRLGDNREASGFVRWLVGNIQRNRGRTHILYGIDERSDLTEQTLDHLEGYMGSRPVRIGNGAWDHLQMDVFGSVLLSLSTYQRYGGYISPELWKLVEELTEVVAKSWQRKDRSIWEVRGQPQHFVYSKVMCWVALDRAIQIGEATGYQRKAHRWQQLADAIKTEVLKEGWSDRQQSFVQSYGSEALDASNLIIPMVGFLPPDDLRVHSTIKRTIQELGQGCLIQRYDVTQTDDGLQGGEGAFTMLSFWLIGALLTSGQLQKARDAFQELLGYANHLGLYSEMLDPTSKAFLGNFPQAFSHVGLLHTARNLSLAEELGTTSIIMAA